MKAPDRRTHWTFVLLALFAAVGAAAFSVWMPDRENAIMTLVFVGIFAGFVWAYPGYEPWQDEDD